MHDTMTYKNGHNNTCACSHIKTRVENDIPELPL